MGRRIRPSICFLEMFSTDLPDVSVVNNFKETNPVSNLINNMFNWKLVKIPVGEFLNYFFR